MIVYPNNPEIQEFVVKAQNKIADLSTLLVERGGYLPDALYLLLELSDFIECLDDSNNTFLEEQIIEWIHIYNHRANLNDISFLPITGIEVNIATGGITIGLPINTTNISDYITATNALIRATEHNTLSAIQPLFGYPGYNPNERYHLNKAMYDHLFNLVYPFTDPTVGISKVVNLASTWPNGYFELGLTLTSITLQGVINLNSGGAVNYYRYKKNGTIITGSQVNAPDLNNPIVTSIENTVSANSNITYTFEADFVNGGLKTATTQVLFRQPMYYGIYTRNEINASNVQTLTKLVQDKQTTNLTFVVPTGNTALEYPVSKAMVIFIPGSWGNPVTMDSRGFPYLNDWVFTNQTMTLANGTTMSGILGVFGSTAPTGQTEGTTTFTMKFN